MPLPIRKELRLKHYDYSQNGAYFVTICTHDKKCLFGHIGATTPVTHMVRTTFEKTLRQYHPVICPIAVVMPNHFHAIIVISRADMESAPTLAQIMQSFKRQSTIGYIKLVKAHLAPSFEQHVWQRSYYDRVIRNDVEYQKIWEYIATNPLRWKDDLYFTPL